jgi:putative transposase
VPHICPLLADVGHDTLQHMPQGLKRYPARRWKGPDTRVWQRRYYDHNVRDHQSFVEKLRYIHRNPVKRGLVQKPEDWEWSSFRHYLTAEIGVVEIESQLDCGPAEWKDAEPVTDC